MMSQNYEAEQKQFEAEVVALRQAIDPCMLRELVKAIYVEAPDKSRQKIHIQYDGIVFIPLEELVKRKRRD